MDYLPRFFTAWDNLESMHPFGVVNFAPLFMEYGVAQALALDVDEYLFLDLITPRLRGVRRIKVEARISQRVFWVYVDLDARVVSFQVDPMAPLTWSNSVDEKPCSLVSLIFHYHMTQERRSGFSGRCFPDAMYVPSRKHAAVLQPRSD